MRFAGILRDVNQMLCNLKGEPLHLIEEDERTLRSLYTISAQIPRNSIGQMFLTMGMTSVQLEKRTNSKWEDLLFRRTRKQACKESGHHFLLWVTRFNTSKEHQGSSSGGG